MEQREKRRGYVESEETGWMECKLVQCLILMGKWKGFRLELLFKYSNKLEGDTYLNRVHGIAKEVIKTTKKMKVKLTTNCLG